MIAPFYKLASISPQLEDALRGALLALAEKEGKRPGFPASSARTRSQHADALREMILVERLSYQEAARRLNLTANRVATICRDEGINRWERRA